MDATAQRDEELAQQCRGLRVLLGRLEDAIDALYDAEAAQRVAGRLGTGSLTPADIERARVESEARFLEALCRYFSLATARVFINARVAPFHVTSHMPSTDPAGYLAFFERKIQEDYARLNPNHIGDVLFRMAVAQFRARGVRPSLVLKNLAEDVLYPRDDQPIHRAVRPGARPGAAGPVFERNPTPYEDETKARFWSVALEPGDVEERFSRMLSDLLAPRQGVHVSREEVVGGCAVLADAMRWMMHFDPKRYRACYRVYKDRFTRFLLDERLEPRHAVALLAARARCGMRLQSIASRARDRQRQLDELVKIVRHAETKGRAEEPAAPGAGAEA